MSFQQALTFGKIGEGKISAWLRGRGWSVLPCYDVELGSGKGPRLFMATTSPDSVLIAPDALIMKGCKFIWAEMKTKSHFTFYGKGSCWTDGIDNRHYQDYLKVRERLGLPLWIMFLHENNKTWPDDIQKYGAPLICPTGLYGQEINKLAQSIDHTSDRHANGMVYWRIDSLVKLADKFGS